MVNLSQSKSKMLKIILCSLTLVVSLYSMTAFYGYKSFVNYTSSEFLLMFEYVHFATQSTQIIILLAKVSTTCFSFRAIFWWLSIRAEKGKNPCFFKCYCSIKWKFKVMIVLVVTFSAPLFCFVLRKSVFINMYPDADPERVSTEPSTLIQSSLVASD